ncbi:MAG: glycosyltransferase [Candidatus Pelagibacter sp. TMED106]|nr:MAG: glycosyltransferase [Candidatus Pelagibacter sp. TMED106]|tara:strand:- start:4756 stop:5469 length:714 start_codon:yes stop_codon:yes gene_type:complete
MSDNKKILIFTATYNEAENVENLINSIKLYSPNSHVLIIDDNSPDGTSEIIKKKISKSENIFLISREGKSGLDTAHKEAYEFALKNQYDYLITMDADFSHDPIEIEKILFNLKNYPFVIGSRYIKNGKCLMRGRRLAMSKYGNLLMKFLLRIDCNEFTTSYRGFNLKKLKNFHLNKIQTKGYSFFMGTIAEINRMNFQIKEIPIIFKDREKGYSKIPKFEIVRTLINLVVLSLKKRG